MSRLWSRFGVRGVAVALLLGGVGGGYYLGEDREAQQHSIEAESAFDAQQAEWDLLRERHAAHIRATAAQRAAEAEAARKAAEVAKAAAERAKKAEQAASRKREREKQEKEEAEGATKPYTGPIPASCNEYSGNRKIGCALLLDAGFKIAEMPCLDKLWTKESGWNHKAENRSSGAYGIPQALPGSKMGSVGSDWRTSPATQIKWGLGYVKGRYDTPCGAWAFFQAEGFY
ncbi:lytic transglycosylase domain-containing protein [Plantactinospora sp. KLBMP9567]|uniref:aggregation-promoting factor C-terminal-like domain-containing protein n=1 Tax=Plantactinospora sp. KLBMP9567 TaxID=3085900 RepID=UPI002982332B|nr:lytic transglycosylase domain-containing protein [Plantactinospora sp. KLBMP9567]MDW5326326.1 lytic transglycosylase domain-containing protein [Plantactinospora sp. KLBMP9567]